MLERVGCSRCFITKALFKQTRFWLVIASLSIVGHSGCGKSEPGTNRNETHGITTDHRTTSFSNQLSATENVARLPNDESIPILDWVEADGISKPIALFDHVFWEPDDTRSFRKLLRESDLVKGKTVMEIGTGTGIVSLCCLERGARSVLATDINPWAIRNVRYNAKHMNYADKLLIRQVSQQTPGAWSVVGDDERFDIIFSNPPWEPGTSTHVEDFALYDTDFQLMNSFLDDLPQHLNDGGRAFLAYGCVEAIQHLKKQASRRGLRYQIHDERDLNKLPNLFLPGMLIEVIVPDAKNADGQSSGFLK